MTNEEYVAERWMHKLWRGGNLKVADSEIAAAGVRFAKSMEKGTAVLCAQGTAVGDGPRVLYHSLDGNVYLAEVIVLHDPQSGGEGWADIEVEVPGSSHRTKLSRIWTVRNNV